MREVKMIGERWEYGSEFHLVVPYRSPEGVPAHPWSDGLLYGTGRHALMAVLRHGAAHRNWKRLWIPDYFCRDVADVVQRAPVSVRSYPCSPTEPAWPARAFLEAGDVVLRVNTFGLRATDPLGGALRDDIEVIEDHTHDPWSLWASSSRADWCVASLRKTMPLSDGGVLWSPRGHHLPPPPTLTPHHRSAALSKLGGMSLKTLYLDGAPVEKATFRSLLVEAEQALGQGEVSAISPWAGDCLPSFDWLQWRAVRSQNHARMLTWLDGLEQVRVFGGETNASPLAVIIAVEAEELRDCVRAALIRNSVYPAILWMQDCTSSEREFGKRMLAIHCDGRYTMQDVDRAGAILREALLNAAYVGVTHAG